LRGEVVDVAAEKHDRAPRRAGPDGKSGEPVELAVVTPEQNSLQPEPDPQAASSPCSCRQACVDAGGASQGAADVEADNRKVIEELREQIKRMQADFENFKRRQEQAREDMRTCAKEDVLKSLLPVLDNLEWALHSTKQSKNFDAFFEGITLVSRNFKELLTREGLTEITALGGKFDPTLHQAIAMEEREDLPDETVTEEFQKGYQLGGRTVRPSLVKVARVPQ